MKQNCFHLTMRVSYELRLDSITIVSNSMEKVDNDKY